MTGATVKTGLKDGYGSAKDNILAGMKDGGAAALKPPKPALKDTGKLRKQLTAMKDGGAVKNKVNGGDKLAQDTEKQSKGLTAKQNIMQGMADGGGVDDSATGLRAVAEVYAKRGQAGIDALKLGQVSARRLHGEDLGAGRHTQYQNQLRSETERAYNAIVGKSSPGRNFSGGG